MPLEKHRTVGNERDTASMTAHESGAFALDRGALTPPPSLDRVMNGRQTQAWRAAASCKQKRWSGNLRSQVAAWLPQTGPATSERSTPRA